MREKTENSLEIFVKANELIESNESFAIALVLNAEGSTPRKEGARAIITNTGKLFGTIGGGAVECEAQRHAIESCKTNKPVIFDFELQGLDRQGDTPICGGKMRILIHPISVRHKDIFNQVAQAIKLRNKGIFLTTINKTQELQIEYEFSSVSDDSTQPCMTTETKEVFVEPIIPGPLLVIAGGGHIGQALAIQASLVGFDIFVLDDRSEFTIPELFPKNTKTICGDIAQELSKIPAEKDTYIVIVTRGHKDDAQALEACINKPFKYIGMIGSKRKVALIRESLIQSGVCSSEQFEKVFTPIGLNIGALTVPEIATSITAELIAVRRMEITHKPWKDKEVL